MHVYSVEAHFPCHLIHPLVRFSGFYQVTKLCELPKSVLEHAHHPKETLLPISQSPWRPLPEQLFTKAHFSSFPPIFLNPRHGNGALGMLTGVQLHHSMAWPYNHFLRKTQNSVTQAWGKQKLCVLSPWPCSECLPFVCLHVKSCNLSSAVVPGFSSSSYLVISQGNTYTRALKTDFPLSKPTHLSMRPPWLVHPRLLSAEQMHDFFSKHTVNNKGGENALRIGNPHHCK